MSEFKYGAFAGAAAQLGTVEIRTPDACQPAMDSRADGGYPDSTIPCKGTEANPCAFIARTLCGLTVDQATLTCVKGIGMRTVMQEPRGTDL